MMRGSLKKMSWPPDTLMSIGDNRMNATNSGEHDRGEREQRPAAAAGPQEPEADAEEAAEQHEVGEVRQVDDVRARPADERQLHEQHQEAEQDQPRPIADQPLRSASAGRVGSSIVVVSLNIPPGGTGPHRTCGRQR